MLANSLGRIKSENYELIVVDDYPNRNLKQYLEEKGVRVGFYGPSKGKCYPDTIFNQINAINTGILQSTGDIVLILEDYSWIPPDYLDRWETSFRNSDMRTLIAGTARVWNYRPPNLISDETVWDTEFTGNFFGEHPVWMPEEWEWFNSGIPMNILEELNGLDEKLDYWREYTCSVWPTICKALGFKFRIDKENCIDIINHRGWNEFNPKFWHINRLYDGGPPTNQISFVVGRAPNCFDLKLQRRRLK